MSRKKICISCIVAVSAVVIALLILGQVDMADFQTQLAVGLTLLIPTILVFMFIEDIIDRVQPNRRVDSIRPFRNESQRLKARLSMQMGSADYVDTRKIWHYSSRERMSLPKFMQQAKKRIRMSALTFSLLTLQHEELLSHLASNKIKLTFLILDPHSEEAKRQTSLFKSSDDLIDQINKSLQRLCKLKEQYPKNVFIRTYNKLHGNSIIILDDSTIKVETHVVDSGPNSRPNEIIFKKDSKREFLNYRKEYDELEKLSTEHTCQSTLSLK